MTEYSDFNTYSYWDCEDDENTFNFEDGKGSVPAHKHPNGGGWVANTANVEDTVYVEPNSRVCDDAMITGNVVVSGRSCVRGNVIISGNKTRVFSKTRISGIERSDGYTFIYVPDADGVMKVQAGCRDFTMEEAKKHWKKTRGRTLLGDETMAILNCLEILSKVKSKGCV